MVVNIVDVGWATSKSGCLPITGFTDMLPKTPSKNHSELEKAKISLGNRTQCTVMAVIDSKEATAFLPYILLKESIYLTLI